MTYLAFDWTTDELASWLRSDPAEDELRRAYLTLETRRADLWTPGHIDSFRRDRYEVDAHYVRQLVEIKRALARLWAVTGQLDRAPEPAS